MTELHTLPAQASPISTRKADHIDLCATGDVGFRAKTTLFEGVELVHDALPELVIDDIDTSIELLGKKLRVPLVIAAMTGGTERARGINRELARIAEERGYGFGLGSQRAILKGEPRETYMVRDVAPTTLVLGNIGGVQAKSLETAKVMELVEAVGADALCVHLNPAQEIVQPGGDRDFEGVVGALERLVAELAVPVVAKETGCGIGPRAAKKLAKAGVRHVDVSGAGGTSWVAVETARAAGQERSLGVMLRDWGVPTAASVLVTREMRPRFKSIIATGGVTNGVDVAKAIALGAHAAGIARPVLQALLSGGRDGALAFLDQVESELRAVMLLVGARDVRALRRVPTLLSPDLERWAALAAGGRKK
ncbi:type 2 isopentenyl-diphosphate Delta-isomerase [Polyangium jinanense]|uniref:Isopentenyl-diphosphate delta-isomerase n=1 Tax=Polyangium jinanense TaxID=2829994 RepID=A0A9X4AYN5_9BACT|nr:type 2 isopentenyl-diphosphate Delta-isomerase [Polyangium jinanense]MDC3960815.1 type 2 isopentenyl-diphosphate Delta-isomerase [Polyangium jinanense]MDC3961020.1 type 2 isopentenyl-diphosphate Delta-isomerase [Polyangium jinanense]MDC3987440.1 type 2 isopentenyl-diphosphate Delta-isomerase [Polyangium jinanense]